jgi:biopolymer transport protein ExbB
MWLRHRLLFPERITAREGGMTALPDDRPRDPTSRRVLRTIIWTVGFLLIYSRVAMAAEGRIFHEGQFNLRELLRAGGAIGYVTIGLSVAMVALIAEHLLTIRRSTLVPPGFAEQCQKLLTNGQIEQAEALCREKTSLLSYVVGVGLQDSDLGVESMIKAMEDAIAEQSARLTRKIEYLSLIGVIGPMLGLMGTVWGMIQAFAEFAEKAAPRTADFAPSISEALVTTLFGLLVAVPAQTAFAMFRNRIDSYIAEAAVSADSIIAPLKRRLTHRKVEAKQASPSPAVPPAPPSKEGRRP